MHSRMATQLVFPLLLATATACGSDAAVCVHPPCPLSLQLSIADSATGKPVSGPVVTVSGAESGEASCEASGICTVLGSGGTYTLDVTAAGHRAARQQVVVTGSGANAACGCASVDTHHLTLALAPTG